MSVDASRCDNGAVAEAARAAMDRLSEAARKGVRSVALMPDASYNSETGAVTGLAVRMAPDTPVADLLKGLVVDTRRLAMGASMYAVSAVARPDDFTSADGALQLRTKELGDLVRGAARASGLVDSDEAAARLTQYLDVGVMMGMRDVGHGLQETWMLHVSATAGTKVAALSGTAEELAKAMVQARSDGDLARNVLAQYLAAQLGLTLAEDAVKATSPWDGQEVLAARPSVKNEWNVALETGGDVVLYVGAIAGPSAYGGVLYKHTRAQGLTLFRGSGRGGTVTGGDAQAHGAMPFGFPRRERDRAAPITPADVQEADQQFVSDRRIQWADALPYHSRLRSGAFVAVLARPEQSGSMWARLYGGAPAETLRFYAKYAFIPGSSQGNMTLGDKLEHIRAFEPGKKTEEHPWKSFMAVFARFRERLGTDARYSLAELGRGETVPGETISVPIALLQQLYEWSREDETDVH